MITLALTTFNIFQKYIKDFIGKQTVSTKTPNNLIKIKLFFKLFLNCKLKLQYFGIKVCPNFYFLEAENRLFLY